MQIHQHTFHQAQTLFLALSHNLPPLTSFLARWTCFSSSSGIILPLWDTDLKLFSYLQIGYSLTALLHFKWIRSMVSGLLPFITFNEVHILCAKSQERCCLLHRVMTLSKCKGCEIVDTLLNTFPYVKKTASAKQNQKHIRPIICTE